MLIKSQSEVRLHTGRSIHFHPSRFTRPSFRFFKGLVPRLVYITPHNQDRRHLTWSCIVPYTAKNVLTPIQFRCQKVPYIFGTESVPQQHQDSIRSVRTYMYTSCLRAVFVELIQSCRTDTDPWYQTLLPKCYVVFVGTDLDQISSSSYSILLCIVNARLNHHLGFGVLRVVWVFKTSEGNRKHWNVREDL